MALQWAPEDPLEALRWHWGAVYVIHYRDEVWTAQYFISCFEQLRASSAEELRRLIWRDYFSRNPNGRTRA